MKNTTILLSAVCAALFVPFVVSAAFTQTVIEGDAAIAKFPQEARNCGLWYAKCVAVTNGVEYMFGRFTNLDGGKNDLHIIRIDYNTAPIRMKFVNSTENSTKTVRTSTIAERNNAVFGINGTYQGTANGHVAPQGFTKFQGAVVPNGNGCNGGIGMNDDKTYLFNNSWNASNAADYSDVITTEAYGLHNGNIVYGSRSGWGKANYPFVGKTPNDIIYVCVVDGRRTDSVGMTYYTTVEFLQWLGCTEGMTFDGGGSTTMVFRKDMMPAADIAYTQHTSDGSSKYYTMNQTTDASERAVINQLLFVEVPYKREIKSVTAVNDSDGAVKSFTVEVNEGREDNYLYACCGDHDYGADPETWPVCEYAGKVGIDDTVLEHVAAPEGWNAQNPVLKFFLAKDTGLYDSHVEYLASTSGGLQHIDTGYLGQKNDVYDFKFRIDSLTGNAFLGSRGIGSGQYYSYLYIYPANFQIRCNGNTSTMPAATHKPVVGADYYARTTMGESYQKLELGFSPDVMPVQTTLSVDFSTVENTSLNQFLFGATKQGGTIYAEYPFVGRMYYWRVAHEGVPVRDMIPVAKGGVGYMYDKVTKRLFENVGTTPFSVGPVTSPRGKDYSEGGYEPMSASQTIQFSRARTFTPAAAGKVKVLDKCGRADAVYLKLSATPSAPNATNYLYAVYGTETNFVREVTSGQNPFIYKAPGGWTESGTSIKFLLKTKTPAGNRYAVEYIKNSSAGGQYLDTGWKLAFGDEYDLQFRNEATTAEYELLASHVTGSSNYWSVPRTDKTTSCAAGYKYGLRLYTSINGSTGMKAPSYTGTDARVYARIDNGNQYMSVQEGDGDGYAQSQLTSTTAIEANIPTLYLFGRHYYNNGDSCVTSTMMYGRVYFLRIKHNGEFVRDYVPCVQNGVAGMWDRANRTFTASKSSTAFEAGPRVADNDIDDCTESTIFVSAAIIPGDDRQPLVLDIE